jgi:CheY-like chemotaxis protein
VQRFRSYVGRIWIVCNQSSRMLGKLIGAAQAFSFYGWSSQLIFIKDATQMVSLCSDASKYDVILLDLNMTFIKWKTGHPSPSHVSSHFPIGDFITFDAKDSVQLLRAHGYDGLIVLFHLPAPETTAESRTVATTNRLRRREQPPEHTNVYIHAVAADLFIEGPLTAVHLDSIIAAAEKKLFSNL